MSSNDPQIKIGLSVDIDKFLVDIKSALEKGEQAAQKAAQNISSEISNGMKQAAESVQMFQRKLQEITAGKAGSLAINVLPIDKGEIQRAHDLIKQTAKDTGQSMRQTALDLVSLGKVDAQVAAQVIANNRDKRLSYDEVKTALERGAQIAQGKLQLYTAAEEKLTKAIKDATAAQQQQAQKLTVPAIQGAGKSASPVSSDAAILEANKQLKEYITLLEQAGFKGQKAAMQIATADNQIVQAEMAMNKIQAELGVTRQRAAQIAIASGQAYVGAVQKQLAAEEEEVLNVKQLQSAIGGLGTTFGKAAIEAEKFDKALKEAKPPNAQFRETRGIIDNIIITMNKFNSVLGFFSLLQYSLKGVIDFIGQYAQKATEAEQATFRLGVAIQSSIDKSGAAASSFKDWQKDIDALSKKFSYFSKTDINNAVAQVIALTNSLNISKDKMLKLVETAAALSNVAGVPLTQAINDITHAMGGSSVTMDKYNVLIREGDKNQQALKDGLNKTVTEMNSEELALTTLNLIFDRAQYVIKNVGGYSETTAGQIQTLNAQIENTNVSIGENLQQIQLAWQNATLNALEFFNTVIAQSKEFQAILKWFEQYNKTQREQRKQTGEGAPSLTGRNTALASPLMGPGERTLTMDAVLSQLPDRKYLYGFTKKDFESWSENINGIKYFSDKQLQALVRLRMITDEEAKRYSEALQKFRSAYITNQKEVAQEKVTGPDTPAESEDRTKSRDAIEKAGKDIISAYNKWRDDQNAALKKRNEDLAKANDDYVKSIRDLGVKVQREYDKLAVDVRQKREDAELDKNRKLIDLDTDIEDQRLKLQQKFADDEITVRDDALKRLRELEMQYLFDLRDAVAENDAVAIKRLERKFNLDKAKIDQDVGDKLRTRQDEYNKELQDLDKSIEERRKKIEQDYQNQLQDIIIFEQRRREEIEVQRQQEIDDINQKLADQKSVIEAEYNNQLDIVRNHYYDRLREIGSNLAEEGIANATWIDEDLKRWQKYFDDRRDIITGFYTWKAQNEGDPSGGYNGSNLMPNYVIPSYYGVNTGGTGGSNALDINVKIASDDLTEGQKEQVAVIIADAMDEVIVRLGNNYAR